jgi:hypothetical protein
MDEYFFLNKESGCGQDNPAEAGRFRLPVTFFVQNSTLPDFVTEILLCHIKG